jgi:thiol-disulfide isomerase/thioredoxin
MLNKTMRHRRRRGGAAWIAGMTGIALALGATGCGRSESPPDAAVSTPTRTQAAVDRPAPAPTPPRAAIPAPDVPEDAPILADQYPTLPSGALRYARLTDLPDGILLQAEGVSVTQADLDKVLADLPPEMREQMQRNAFFMLEQNATLELLTALARGRSEDPTLGEELLLQRYFEELTRTVSVTDAEVTAFYEQNRDLVGDAPLEQLTPRIREHLRQQKQQELIESHVAELGRETTIALSAPWVKEQAARALDNPVDKARASGKPTFVNFGANGCVPCDMMDPIREELKTAYEGQLNVVFVHVNEERTLSSRYGVRGIPHLVFFDKDGKQVHTHTGFMPREQIEEWLVKIGVPAT